MYLTVDNIHYSGKSAWVVRTGEIWAQLMTSLKGGLLTLFLFPLVIITTPIILLFVRKAASDMQKLRTAILNHKFSHNDFNMLKEGLSIMQIITRNSSEIKEYNGRNLLLKRLTKDLLYIIKSARDIENYFNQQLYVDSSKIEISEEQQKEYDNFFGSDQDEVYLEDTFIQLTTSKN